MKPSRLFAIAAASLLAACTTQPVRAPVAGDPKQHQIAREQALAAHPDWSLQGRVALSNGHEGGSGRIDWRQAGARYRVVLDAPITRQGWQLEGDDAHARLDGLAGGPREGDDPTRLLFDATHWDIPVAAMAQWVRGARADETRHGPASLTFATDGRLAGLVQDGWTLAYDDWRPAGGAVAELPGRVEATRGKARVRLVIDRWGTDPIP
jgi:outer membrane lipoprotein LolB